MKSLKYLFMSLMMTAFIFVGCKSTQQAVRPIKELPAAYDSLKDTANNADMNWKQYFSDADLITLVEEALKNNMDVAMAAQRIEAARSTVRLAKGALLPTVSANASFWQRKFGYYTMDDAGNRTTEIRPREIVPTHLPDYYLGLQTSWEIDIWGKLRNKRKAALNRYLATVEGKNFIITNLIADVANSYYELLALDNKLDIVRESIKIQEKAVELVTIQKEARAANALAVKQLEAQSINSKALEYELQQEITECESRINFLLGRYPQPVSRNKENFHQALKLKVQAGIPSSLLKNRPDIRLAEQELLATRADVKAARAAFYPSLNITGSGGLQSYNIGLLFSPLSLAYSALGSLVTPLLNRSAIKAEFNTASAVQQEALFNYQKTIFNGYVEVYNELARINNLEKIVDLRSKEASVWNETSDISNDLFKTGHSNYIEVLMIQKGGLESKLQLIDARKRQYNALVDIYKALGGGWK